MKSISINDIRIVDCDAAVIGSGAAGLNAAAKLVDFKVSDVLLVTEDLNAGTSRNTGSDKQTYYKLSLAGDSPDSVREMAKTLFDGQCVDGELALCEAALSANGFFRLVELGVPFPKNRWGEFVGYKTDHDPRCRATSIGPYTSRKMTECLEKDVTSKNVRVLDRMQALCYLADDAGDLGVQGLLCFDKADNDFVIIRTANIIQATGGPSGMYLNNVYPVSQHGCTGMAFEAGAKGRNLTEWQCGLGSVNPRWNVSGTYMQVLPRFVSTDENGLDEREFLDPYFSSRSEMLGNIFMKGYQWPFDIRKASHSSLIDILVHIETSTKRRVFLDFRNNPGFREVDFTSLPNEAKAYLEKAGACFGTPIERLGVMNSPAIAFYKDKGVDLDREMLEIALCIQHNNGGLAVDCWWQTNVKGLFAVGELAGSHGVYRPGGSALNAGQVGSLRAAEYVSKHLRKVDPEAFAKVAQRKIDWWTSLLERMIGDSSNIEEVNKEAIFEMSRVGSVIRNLNDISNAREKVSRWLFSFGSIVRITGVEEFPKAMIVRDCLISQYVYLGAMLDYIYHGGKSRGSALYSDPEGCKAHERLPEEFRFSHDDSRLGSMIQEIGFDGKSCTANWRKVHPIPEGDDFFENVWNSFRENGNVY
jgi:succinate dehydrogenase/fumarate reductase flavoprotein subunit